MQRIRDVNLDSTSSSPPSTPDKLQTDFTYTSSYFTSPTPSVSDEDSSSPLMRESLSTPIRQPSISQADIYKIKGCFEKKLLNTQTELESAKAMILRLEKGKEGLEEALDASQTIIKEQSSQISELTEQRNQLMKLYKQLNDATEHIGDKLQPEPIKQPKKQDEYEILAEVSLIVGTDDFKFVGATKRDESKTPLQRTYTIIQHLVDEKRSLEEENRNLKKELKIADVAASNYKKQSLRVLSDFEDEILFLQKLMKSRDLQDVVFFDRMKSTGERLSQDVIDELASHCMSMRMRIEQQIGTLTHDKIDEYLHNAGFETRTGIFDLMENGDKFATKVQAVFDRVKDSDDLVTQELFDLFVAESIITEITQNYAFELQSRLASQPRMSSSPYTGDHSSQLREENAQLLKKERKIDRFLTKTLGDCFDGDVVKGIRVLLNQIKEESDLEVQKVSQKLQKKNKKLHNLRQQFNEEREAAKKEVIITLKDEHLKEVAKMEEHYRQEISKANKDMESQSKEIENLKAKLLKAKQELQEERQGRDDDMNALKKENDEFRRVSQRSIEKIKQKTGGLRSQFEAALTELKTKNCEINQLKEAIRRIECEKAEALSQVDRMRTEYKTMQTKIKIITDEASTREGSYATQLTTQKNASRMEIERLQRQISDTKESILQKIGQLFQGISGCERGSIEQRLDAIGFAYRDALANQKIYAEMIDDIGNVQSLLDLERGDPISRRVKTLVEENKDLQMQIRQLKTTANNRAGTTEKLQTEVDRLRNQIAALKQWQIWASRLNSVVKDVSSVNLTDERLRQSLEELVLNSRNSHSTSVKNRMLLDEKRLLRRFGSDLLYTHVSHRPSMGSLLLAIVSIRRIQAVAGCLRFPTIRGEAKSNAKRRLDCGDKL